MQTHLEILNSVGQVTEREGCEAGDRERGVRVRVGTICYHTSIERRESKRLDFVGRTWKFVHFHAAVLRVPSCNVSQTLIIDCAIT